MPGLDSSLKHLEESGARASSSRVDGCNPIRLLDDDAFVLRALGLITLSFDLKLHQRNRRCELFRPFGAQEFSLFSLSVVCRLPKPNPTSIAGRLTRWLQFFRRCRFKNSFPLRN